jgi:hypothetical protein
MAKRKRIMKEFRIDEISAVDHPAQPTAKATIMKRKHVDKEDDELPEDEENEDGKKKPKGKKKPFGKRGLLTAENDGHSHLIQISDERGDTTSGHTSGTEMGNASGGPGIHHSHPWTLTPLGEFVIGTAAGHSHTVLDGTMSKVEDGMPDPSETQISSGDSADMVGNVHKEDSMSDTNDQTAEIEAVAKQLDEVTKRAERAELVSELNDAQRGIFKGLDTEGQDGFLAMTADQRDAEVAKAADADAVVYKSLEGDEFRKSDDPRLIAMAKRDDEKSKQLAKMAQDLVDADLEKRADELSHLPGDVAGRVSLLKGIDALPEGEREGALAILKAKDAGLAKAFERVGVTGTPEQSEGTELDQIAKRFRDEDPTLSEMDSLNKALGTPEGEAAYNASR